MDQLFVARETGVGGGVDYAPEALTLKIRPDRLAHVEDAAQRDVDHAVPGGLADASQRCEVDHARIVDEHRHLPESVECGGHHRPRAVAVGHAVRIGDGAATRRDDLFDDSVRHRGGAARTIRIHARVVDHDGGTARGEGEGIAPPKSASGPRDDDDIIVEAHLVHV